MNAMDGQVLLRSLCTYVVSSHARRKGQVAAAIKHAQQAV